MPTTTIKSSQLRDIAIFLRSDGSVAMTAPFNAGTQRIINIVDPTLAQDAATKNYVDNLVQGLKPKTSVKASTTANITLSAPQTIDGVPLVAGDRVLVKDQTVSNQNGIYVVAAAAWTRATDTDTWIELVSAFVFVEQGTANADKAYNCTVDQGGTLGTTNVTWVLFGSLAGLLSNSNFVTRETPTGLLNGTNTTYTLAFAPTTGTERVFLNGILQASGAGNDYTISAGTITYLTAPVALDTLVVSYMK
jgi:phage-related tail fiber protein